MVACGLAAMACMGGGRARGLQLYEGAPDPTAVRLVGDVGAVDGREMPARSRTFDLLPGCHFVTNVTYWVGNDHNAAMAARLSPRTYAVNMQPGHTYELRIGTTANSDAAQVVIKALERNAAGEVTRTFEPGGSCGS